MFEEGKVEMQHHSVVVPRTISAILCPLFLSVRKLDRTVESYKTEPKFKYHLNS
jgi:hypothetical protein